MNAVAEYPEILSATDPLAIKVTVIYEDLASGLRAKQLVDRLGEEIGCACPLPEFMWRSDLLDAPSIAAEAVRAAADCDYLIVSLRGERVMPRAARRCVERVLEEAAGRGLGVIVLTGSSPGTSRVVKITRNYLRSLCLAKGAAYFSSVSAEPEADRAVLFRDEKEELHPSQQHLSALLDG